MKFNIFAVLTLSLIGCGDPAPSVQVTPRLIAEKSILIQDVSVFDSESLQTLPHMDVVVSEGLIASVSATGEVSNNDAHIISGAGATLVPGLIDMHGHLTTTNGPSWEFALPTPEIDLLAYAYSGVTTIFDPSDSSNEAFSRREKVANGEIIGPRIFTTGRIITSPEGHPRALVEELAPWWIKWYLKPKVATGVSTQEEAIAAVDERIDAGADGIKIVVDQIPLDAEMLRPELIKSIVDQATSRGIRTVAHVGTTGNAVAAAEAGISLWVHGIYKEPIPDNMIEKLVSYGIPMVTTSEVFDRYGRAQDGPIIPTKLEKETVAKSVLDSFFPIPEDFDPGPLLSWAELMHETKQVRLDNVAKLHAAGMTILAGSDAQSGVFPGASLHRELVSLVEAGLTPAQAIRAATFDAASYLANGGMVDAGSITVGMRADLLLVEGDPTSDINALANIREVMLNGVLLDRVAVGQNE